MCVRLLLIALLLALQAAWPAPSDARVHVRPRIILRTIPRRQWTQMMTSVRDVKHSIGALERGNRKSITTMNSLRTEIGALKQQLALEQTLMLGSFAALVIIVLPALRNSTVNLLSSNLFDRLRTEQRYDDQIRPVASGLTHDRWIENPFAPRHHDGNGNGNGHHNGNDNGHFDGNGNGQYALVPTWMNHLTWHLEDQDQWDVDRLMNEVQRKPAN